MAPSYNGNSYVGGMPQWPQNKNMPGQDDIQNMSMASLAPMPMESQIKQ